MAFEAQGTRLYWSSSTSVSTSADALIGGVMGFNGPDGAASEIDITDLASTAKEFIPGLRDEGSISIDLLFLTTDTAQSQMISDRASRTKSRMAIDYNDASSSRDHFEAYCMSFAKTGAVDDAVKATVGIRITGPITQTTV